MKKKPRKSPYRPTLVTCELVPITDAVEIAELERRIAEAEKMLAGANGTAKKPKSAKRRSA
jgi:hypothetical protein